MGNRRFIFIPAGLLIIAFLMAVSPAAAADITVNTVTELYDAVNTASSGDTIILNPDTYTLNGPIVITGKRLTIQANTSYGHGRTDTSIDGGGGVLFYNSGPSLTIDNLTLQNGFNSDGGAITNVGGNVIITGSTIADCRANIFGGAIYNVGGTVTITGSTITGCTSSSGGAIYNGGTVTITGSSIIGCTALSGGAITNDVTILITGSSITGCTAGSAGAISNSGSVTIDSSRITGCRATTGDGGAIYSDTSSGIVTVRNSSEISDCISSGSGGAISISGGTLDVSSTLFTDCEAADYGGAISAAGSSVNTISSTSFSGCDATEGGGAIAAFDSSSLSVLSSDFEGCTAGSSGGAIFSFPPATIHFSRFHGNTASGSGTAVRFVSSSSTATNNWWSSNSGPGAAYFGPNLASWLVLGATADSASITPAGTSTIRANLTFDSNGNYHDPAGGHVPDTITGTWARTAGTGSVSPETAAFADGANTTQFSPGNTAGTSTVTATVDGQPASVPVTVAYFHPVVSSISPATGRVNGGEMIEIRGLNFNGTGHIGANAVMFGTTPSFSYHEESDTLITAIAPTHPVGMVDVIITTPGGTSTATSSDEYTYTNQPVVTSVTPPGGPSGDTLVTVRGIGLAGATDVRFGSVSAPLFIVDSDMQITVLNPTGTPGSTIHVTVITPEGTSATSPADLFTFAAPAVAPVVTLDTSGNDDGFPSATPIATQAGTFPAMTVTVNIGGDSKAWQAVVTGTKLQELIVTGTVQPGSGSNVTAPPGIVFQFISLVPARFTSITNAVIHFTVPQSWLDENHIDPKSIVLYHQTANGWEALPTTVLYTKDGTMYFSAESAGFSLFAIAGTAAVLTPPGVAATQDMANPAVLEPAPSPASFAEVPVTTQTTAPPVTTPQPAAPSPLLNIMLAIAAIGVLAGGGFMIRRWWIRHQNPALFREYD